MITTYFQYLQVHDVFWLHLFILVVSFYSPCSTSPNI